MFLNFQLIGFIISFIWLIGLSLLFWQLLSHYNNLTKGVSNKSLKIVLDEVLRELGETSKEIEILKKKCLVLEKDGILHIQKVGLLRFNPFEDTGGDQSFVLSLINGNDTGIVISSLYSRAGTRWYAKRVIDGKGLEHELSEEEKKAIKEAKKI